MKIGIDLRAFYTGSKYRGIGTYSRELIREMLRLAPENEYHFLNLYGDFPESVPLNDRCIVHSYYQGPMVADCGERNLFRVPELEAVREAQVKDFLRTSKVEWMLFTSPLEYGNPFRIEWFQSVHTAAILYDLIPLAFPQQCLYDARYKADYMESLDFLRGVDRLLAISQFTKDDAIRRMELPEESIRVISSGIADKFLRAENPGMEEIKKHHQIRNDFFLFAGGIDFKKNIENIIAAYAALPQRDRASVALVITGKANQTTVQHYMDEAKRRGVADAVFCTGFVSDEELLALYCNAKALVFPSLYEGFGLPVIEAMACGTPVITSDCSSLKEIAEGHALLVDPESKEQICKAMQRVLHEPATIREMAQDAIPYARQFTWERVAQRALSALEEAEFPAVCAEVSPVQFHADNGVLRTIARQYQIFGLPFSQKESGHIADELYALEKQIPFPVFPAGKRILYDVTVARDWFAHHYSTGIGRVSLEIYRELKKYAEVIPVSVEGNDERFLFHLVDMKTYQIRDEEVAAKPGDIYFMPELQIRGIQIPVNHPHPSQLRAMGISTYAVVHDILPLQMPQYFEEKTAREFRSYLNGIIVDYDGVLAVSRAVADDLTAYLAEYPNLSPDHELRIGFFHHGMDALSMDGQDGEVSPVIEEIFDCQTFLMVGTIEPRKGHEYVLNTFEKLWSKGSNAQLCMVGHMGWNMDRFIQRVKQHEEYGKKLFFLEAAPDNVLCYAYRHAVALIQASAGEGFGLPLIEAGCYSLPVLCSDIPVFHEVAGDNVAYFKRDTDELEQLICAVMSKDRAIIKDSSKIERTHWQDSARKVANMILGGSGWYKTIGPDGTATDAVQKPEVYQTFAFGEEETLPDEKRVLFVFQNDFLQGGQGTNNRVKALARAILDAGYTLDVLGAEHFSDNSYSWDNFEEENRRENLIDILRVYDYQDGYKEKGPVAQCYKKMREKFGKQTLQDWTRPGMRCMLEEMLSENDYDAVCVFYSYLLPLFEDLPFSGKKIYFMEDCSFLQQHSFGDSATLGTLLDEELTRLNYVDEIVCISYDEKIMYEKLTGRDVHFLPHLMGDHIPVTATDVKTRKWDAFFVGFNNPFNVEGVQWYLDCVVPLLPEDFKTVIVGSVTKELEAIPDNADVIPFAEDLEDIYNNGKICICPMFRGTGMKIKVVEAMAHGIPIVCNSRGVDGLPDKTVSGCIVTNDAAEFANAVNRLVRDSAFYQEKVAQVRAYYRSTFDRERYIKVLREIMS